MATPSEILSKGLLKGYASEKPPELVNRRGFPGKSIHFDDLDEEGSVYHDEWFGRTSGGGQELVHADKGDYLRTYWGGTAPESTLTALETDADEVGSFLIEALSELGDKTRLFLDSPAFEKGELRYTYHLTDVGSDVVYTTGAERVTKRGRTVHFHGIGLAPIK